MARRTAISRFTVTKLLRIDSATNSGGRYSIAGFNLAEVMVALVLIVVALFALVAMQAHAMRSQTDSRESHLASVIAGSLLAQAEAKLEEDFEADVTRQLSPVADYPDFEGQVQVRSLGDELKTIKVEVRWINGPRAARRSVETTVAAPY